MNFLKINLVSNGALLSVSKDVVFVFESGILLSSNKLSSLKVRSSGSKVSKNRFRQVSFNKVLLFSGFIRNGEVFNPLIAPTIAAEIWGRW